MAPAFDPNLLVSMNLAPVHLSGVLSWGQVYVPFVLPPKVPTHALVIKDRREGSVRLVLLDLEDAAHFEKVISDGGGGSAQLGLYHLVNGLSRSSSSDLTEEALQRDLGFVALVSQAKFFAGQVDYSEAERIALRQWLDEVGVNRLQAFFYERVLEYRPSTQERYLGSDLDLLFEEMLAS